MSSGTPSWSVNGEYATAKDLQRMEDQAFELLRSFPAEYHRHYGYLCADGSALALFSTHMYEEDASEGSIASVALERQADDQRLFEITYGYDNQPSHIYYASDEALPDAVAALQRFIDEGQVPEPDIHVLRFMQSVAFSVMGACKPEELVRLPATRSDSAAHYVAEVIRDQVLKNTNGTVRTKVWGLPLDEADSTLTIASNEVLGELTEHEDIAGIPTLQIEYEDKTDAGVVYIYSRYRDGECRLVTTQPDSEEVDESLEDELAEFRDSIGATVPGQKDVKLLSAMLSRAVILDLPTN